MTAASVAFVSENVEEAAMESFLRSRARGSRVRMFVLAVASHVFAAVVPTGPRADEAAKIPASVHARGAASPVARSLSEYPVLIESRTARQASACAASAKTGAWSPYEDPARGTRTGS